MPPIILKPDNFMANKEIVNVQTGSELLAVTKRIYKIPHLVPNQRVEEQVHIEFWTGSLGYTKRRRFHPETEQIPEDPLTLYVKIIVPIRHLPTVLDETDPGASQVY